MNTIEVTYNEIVPTAPQPDWYVVEITNSKGFTFYHEEFDTSEYDQANAMYTAFVEDPPIDVHGKPCLVELSALYIIDPG